MRIATYNVEWFDGLFDDRGGLLDDGGWSGRRDVTRTQQIAALSVVFQRLDADAVMVIEAPDSSRKRDGARALETFAAHAGLRARQALIGFANSTQQEIALLYDPDKMTAQHAPLASDDAPQFDQSLEIDLDIDDRADQVTFSKPPLEIALQTSAGAALRLIGVHIKSKAPHGARSPEDVLRISIANRRKQLAQSLWLRRRVSAHLAAKEPLMVMGDFNDGPGLDQYEALFGRSGLEIVLGQDGPLADRLFDPHARRALSGLTAARDVTARFWIHQENRFLSALLDYIMVSGDLQAKNPVWKIWHPFDEMDCYTDLALREALLIASDHFPVSLDIVL